MIRLSEMRAPLPPAGTVQNPDVVAAIAAYVRVLEAATEAQAAVTQGDRKLAQAREANVDGFASAIRAGEADPGTRPVEKAERELEAARRRAEASGRAALGARDDLGRLVADRRDALVETADAQVTEARRGLGDALDVLEGAVTELARARSGRAWAAGFPDRAKGPMGLSLTGVVGPNGEPYALDAALVAMRELAVDEPAATPA